MKANKFIAVALAALAVVACKKNEPVDPTTELTLDKTSVNLAIGAETTITASAACEFSVDKTDVLSLTPANDGKSALLKGLTAGTAIVTAKAGNLTKTCVVKVTKGGDDPTPGKQLKGSQIWPIVLDGATYEANESKIVASFQPNDVDQFLYVWEETYVGGDAQGMNSMGNAEGYTQLVVTSKGWSGMGYNLNNGCEGMNACRALRDAIVANPDQYALHMAIKSTDEASHTFYFMNSDKTKFVLGTPFDGGTSIGNFARDGKWYEFEVEMADYASELAATNLTEGCNIFVALSGAVTGTVLNLDAVYFYKK